MTALALPTNGGSAINCNVPMADYHALKALSAHGIADLIDECPLVFHRRSSWAADFVPENKRIFDLGTAAHLAVLEPAHFAERTIIVKADNYKTRAAQEARDGAWAAGKTPLLAKDLAVIHAMQKAIFARCPASFSGGSAEDTLLWDWSGVPCKARPDYLRADVKIITDLKTTTTVNPRAIARKAFNEGWHLRAPWYIEGATRALGGEGWRYIFACVDDEPPHLVECFELSDRALAWGQQIIQRGLRLFRDCMRDDEWPSYGGGCVIPLDLPAYAEHQLADRETAEAMGEIEAVKRILALP